ncbi:thiamine phosphate synthase [Candidatus Zixiibacteriota bacterium]
MKSSNKDRKLLLPKVRLCVITDRRLSRGRSFEEVVKAAIAGGAQMIQFRDKELDDGPFYHHAFRLRSVTREAGVLFIINDRVDVAQSVGADGVHVGEHDLPVDVARQLIGPEMILGASAAVPAEVRKAQAAGADYLGVGAIFPTGTKGDANHVGLERLVQLRPLVDVPILAIGGIAMDNAAESIEAGADGVAVINAVVGAEDISTAAALLLERVRQAGQRPAGEKG